MQKLLTITDFARMGGKARWANKSKRQRSEAMRRVRAGSNPHPTSKHVDKQA